GEVPDQRRGRESTGGDRVPGQGHQHALELLARGRLPVPLPASEAPQVHDAILPTPARCVHRTLTAAGARQRHGSRTRRPGLRRNLADAAREASAQARVRAELELFKSDPRTWLKSGPGRDRTGFEGWASTPKPVVTPANNTMNILLSLELMGLFAALL